MVNALQLKVAVSRFYGVTALMTICAHA